MGKAYANRKPESERPAADYYPTPKFLVRKLVETGALKNFDKILEPACGKAKNIQTCLEMYGFNVTGRDFVFGNDFLKDDYSNNKFDALVTNPPFSLFDKFVEKAKKDFKHIFFIGKTNFFGAHQRNINGVWKHLKNVWIFDRMVNYSEENLDTFDVGMLVTGWFEWDSSWNENYFMTRIIDVQQGVRRK